MKRVLLFFFVLFAIASTPFAQQSPVLNVGGTAISEGDVKLSETLITREGDKLPPGMYKVSVLLSSHGAATFVLAPHMQPDQSTLLKQNSMNAAGAKNVLQYSISANIRKNSLVHGIASNIAGEFKVETLAPTESMLVFTSKQFEANTILGRPLDSKLIDVLPSFLSLDQPTECGVNCIEGYVKVVVRNDGNTEAKGKWNVVLNNPTFFVGVASNIPATQEVTVVSSTKLRLPCCSPAVLEADVHADFYNKNGTDSNDSNNSKKFTVRLKE